jgi:hypothetical protein
MLHRVVGVSVEGPTRLRVVFADEGAQVLDLSDLLEVGGAFAAWRDPAFFALVRVAAGGRSLEWPGGLELCADALWKRSQAA